MIFNACRSATDNSEGDFNIDRYRFKLVVEIPALDMMPMRWIIRFAIEMDVA